MASKIRKFLDIQGLLKLIRLVKNNEQPHWIGTQAEYDSQKANIPNGAIVALTDEEDTTYDHGKFSLVETVTGQRWIDGKPIYRKVIDCGTVTGGTEKYTPHNILNISDFVTIRGMFFAGSQYGPLNYSDGSSDFNVLAYKDGSTSFGAVVRLMPRVAGFSNYHAIVILEYTKTTD